MNDVVVIEADQDIVSCPAAVESAVRMIKTLKEISE